MFYILSVSDSDKHFCSAIQEYEKRLGKDLKIENLKPYKDDNQSFVIEKETTNIIETINKKYKNYQKILLIKEGQSLDTFGFASLIKGKDSVFIIGGPYGVNEQRLKSEYSDLKETSFGAITLPHGLAKLTLIEQIYRATTLWTGKKYHY